MQPSPPRRRVPRRALTSGRVNDAPTGDLVVRRREGHPDVTIDECLSLMRLAIDGTGT